MASAGPACCPGGLAEPLETAAADELARLLKAVADPARLRLLTLIRSGENGEACVCDLTDALGLAQPTVSHHLKRLAHVGVLVRQREGNFVRVRLAPQALAQLRRLFTEPALPALA